MAQRYTYSLILFFFLTLVLASCGDIEPNFSNNPDLKLEFSTDTLRFDTLFTQIASPTKTLKVYNNNKRPLKIERIRCNNNSSSGFRINVDGRSGTSFEDIEIAEKDSLYIFVEVTPPSDSEKTLTLNSDSISFIFNGNTQYVRLEAPSKNAIWIHGGLEITTDLHFSSKTPYLIYDSIVVNANASLIIDKGTTFYMHGDAFFSIHGGLQCDGTITEPIIFQGDRFDDFLPDIPFSLVPGQWGGFIINNPTNPCKFVNTELLGSSFGIIALNDNPQNNELEPLSLINCKLHNAKSGLLFTRNIDTQIYNTEISNSGGKMIVLNGGTHDFSHCTLANLFRWSSRLSPSYNFKENTFAIPSRPIHVSLTNTILDGTIVNSGNEKDTKSELAVIGNSNTTLNIDHCYLSANIDYLKTQCSLNINNCLVNAATLNYLSKGFDNEQLKTNYIYNFIPLETDVVVGKAIPSSKSLLKTDRLGNNRTVPDIGAYQHIKK